MQARLPDDKLHRIRTMVETFLGLSKCIKRELLSLLGHLQFASSVIVPGRSFISRLLEAARGVRELHHFVVLNGQYKEDLTMWHTLLKHWNGVSLFLDIACTSAPDLLLYTDVSGTPGFGGFSQGQWFQGRWPPESENHIPDHQLSMAYKELVPIVAAAEIWGRHWSRKRMLFLCDNQATCAILNKGCSRCSVIM